MVGGWQTLARRGRVFDDDTDHTVVFTGYVCIYIVSSYVKNEEEEEQTLIDGWGEMVVRWRKK